MHKRILSLPIARRWLEWAEENMLEEYPFNTNFALQSLVDRAQTQPADLLGGMGHHGLVQDGVSHRWRYDKQELEGLQNFVH